MKYLNILGLVIVLTVTGCATTSDSQRTQVEGTAVGAGAGALLGALVGGLVGGRDGALIGAAVGAGAGGTAGYMYGTHVANQKEKYAKQEDWLNACIAQAKQVNDETIQTNQALAGQVNQLDSETKALAAAYNQKQVQKASLTNAKQQIDSRYAAASRQLEKARYEVQEQEKAVAQAKGGGYGNEAAMLEEKIRELNQSIAELEGYTRSLAAMSVRMAV
jgi:hypothetical protein